MTTEEDIKRRLELGIITEELEPIKCEKCGSEEYRDKTTDCLYYMEVEKDRFCTKCGELMGIWSYGYWQP